MSNANLTQIKANIGHSEAASGIFAVMKAAMMTEAATIPGVAGFKNINPASKFLDIPKKMISWSNKSNSRRERLECQSQF